MKNQDKNEFYLAKMQLEFEKFCGCYAKILSYGSKVKGSKDITENELKLLIIIEKKFVSEIAHMKKFLEVNKYI